MQSATVFNIQKFSLNDGPGIRTVVFLKGCPLRCRWCSNPESQHREPEVERHPDGREETVGTGRTVEDVLRVCLQDKPFYEDSGGGVTLSGGEALTWPDFCEELVARCHEEGVDTCVETEAHVSEATFRRLAPQFDHLLIDLKHVDPARMREHAGVSGELILSNLRWTIGEGLDVLPRTPVIPGFNNAPEDARTMAQWLREAGATRVQLLPFHNFGENKYALLGRDYAMAGVPNLHLEDLEGFRQIYLDEGIEAFF